MAIIREDGSVAGKKSFPSPSSFMFDVPEPPLFSVKFKYNFFTKDEKTSTDTRPASAKIDNIHVSGIIGTINTPIEGNFNKLARYNLITIPGAISDISGVSLTGVSGLGVGDILTDDEKARFIRYFRDNLDVAESLPSEISSTSRIFTSYTYENGSLKSELQAAITSRMRTEQAVNQDQLTPTQALIRLASTADEKIDSQSLMNNTVLDHNLAYTLVDINTGRLIETPELGNITEKSINFQFNKKFIYDILKNSNTLLVKDESSSSSKKSLDDLKSISEVAVITNNSTIISSQDFEPRVPIFSAVNPSNLILNSVPTEFNIPLTGYEPLGWILYKYELMPDKNYSIVDTMIFIDGIRKVCDSQVSYGKKYRYVLKRVYAVQMTSLIQETNRWAKILTFVTSKTSPEHFVECVEAVPPSAPLVISFAPAVSKGLGIMWNQPLNAQNDIKKYQIFRRSNINEPFYLIAELDFDDSEIKSENQEKVPHYLRIKSDYAKHYYVDREWDRDSKYIYAVCSVDAHGMSSTYSAQTLVGYDRSKGSINNKVICGRGSPKPYPNFTMEQTLVEDSIRDSSHKRLKVYFDPEYLTVYKSNLDSSANDDGRTVNEINAQKEKLEYINFNDPSLVEDGVPIEAPAYKIQLINLDRQASVSLNVRILPDVDSLVDKAREEGFGGSNDLESLMQFYINK